ncbi:putative type II secretion system protein HxcR [Ferriphaselus amnicola]|uniref:Type II secretion system protein E n=1 Tax=Ferriphaselus amnicola TaxID=1188319 RepID=A0A2Z6GB68_9PROT|nr:type II secretion system ATPase GspE [Ferriphaselus amnicola]BBE50697.1 putative type II secretion system protein HxcR [Ferriphaselus amnicola]
MKPATSLVPYAYAKANGVVITTLSDALAEVSVRVGAPASALAELRRVLGVALHCRRIDAEEFDTLIAAAYNGADVGAAALAGDLAQDFDLSRLLQEIPKVEDLLESQDDAPVIRLINALFTQALRDGASDIHIEPFETRSVVRLRIDGTLRDLIEPARALHGAIISRIKIMAQLDIAEKRLPQDGRIALRIAGKPVDVRVSTIPTGHGERIVLRLLDKQAGRLDLTRLGMDEATLTQIDKLIREPHGIVLITGPTGSGKTTTLYAALSRLDAAALNIMTVEDPIEYDLDGINQTQVNARIEMTFARALRTILRQDPDVVMIGEIRDLETAQIAVQASLTGHLVFATLHTNDAVSAVTRLVDMGVEPFLLASSLIGVGAQRLVRCLCLACRRPYAADAAQLRILGCTPIAGTLYAAQGCPACNRSGYRGRTGIYELLMVDDELRRLVHDRASEQTLRTHAQARGMRTLRDDGMRLAALGIISLEEVVRVTGE